MDTPSVIYALLFGFSALGNVGLGIALFRATLRISRLEAREAMPADIEALHGGVEALASQVDQLASGQEFLNRLLTERLQQPPSRGLAGVKARLRRTRSGAA